MSSASVVAVSEAEPAAQSATRRAELAEAAYELIADEGLGGLSMRALARRLGATTGLVSHHFSDRADVIDSALTHATEVITNRIARQTPTGLLDTLSAVLPTDDETLANWRFAFAVRGAAVHDASLRRFDEQVGATWLRYLPGLLEGAVTVAPETAAHHLVAVVDGLAFRAVMTPDEWPLERQRSQLALAFEAIGIDPTSPLVPSTDGAAASTTTSPEERQ